MRHADDRGSVLETVIITPMVLLLFFGALQGALYFHARNVAVKAAESGLRQARGQHGNGPLGTAAAYAFIARNGPTVLRSPVVVVLRGPRDASAHIVAQPIRLIPFLDLTVTVDETQPVERVTRPGQA
ncbi:TadE family protein [Nocardia terpenica]|uniref:TadE-like domain-containing protein n=1 Tax=Nocardia terpenica TaxID=455432 RepID=A0A6G9ZB97_9NOCA|nr:TadE family protein [Nocardia terpenica]QIS22818.1 hypothetical protein F6W96_35260 [Nocardia terpenica]